MFCSDTWFLSCTSRMPRAFALLGLTTESQEALVGFRGGDPHLRDRAGDEGAERLLPAAPRVVHGLGEAEKGRRLLLRDAPVRAEPGAQERPEALGRVDVDPAGAVAVVTARVLARPR